ncbi:MAG: LytTR family DNA-binding domain-containing protein [Bacteroidota bacterium]
MKKISALLVDDEEKALKTLRLLIEKYCPEVEIVDQVENIDDAYQSIIKYDPNMLFLDINMPQGSGLDLLKRIQGIDTEVIFTTAHQEYAIKALRLSALDYLLKPIDPEDLIGAVSRYKERSREKRDYTLINEILNEKMPKRIAISSLDGVKVVNVEDIQYLSADKNYTTFHLNDGELIVSKSLGEFEKLLQDYEFFRVHRSVLINMVHLAEYKKGKEARVRLNNGVELEVSRNRKDQLLEKLKLMK